MKKSRFRLSAGMLLLVLVFSLVFAPGEALARRNSDPINASGPTDTNGTGPIIVPADGSGLTNLKGTGQTAPTYRRLNTLKAGNTVKFAGYTWIVLDPATGYLLMQDSLVDRVFEGNSSVLGLFSFNNTVFNPNDVENIASYLNNTFYNSLPSEDQAVIQDAVWTTGSIAPDGTGAESSSSVNCKIGLISFSEYNKYGYIFISGVSHGVANSSPVYPQSGDWWTRTPASGIASYPYINWGVCSDGSMRSFELATNDTIAHAGVRPALYLKPDVCVEVSGGNGGTVITSAIPVITVVNGVPFSVTINNTSGAFTTKNDTTGADSGGNSLGAGGGSVSGSGLAPGGVLNGSETNVTSVTGVTTKYGSLTGIPDGNNGNIISGTLSGLPTSEPTYIFFGPGILKVEAVDPPSTTQVNASFYSAD
ncbi:hypothetical protein CEB3_c31650 [Peptococcaceae bacterium CEB3]|nr:hypothetical protein CEB3_c31650 [Peptococcaceae bacterium CEB3]